MDDIRLKPEDDAEREAIESLPAPPFAVNPEHNDRAPGRPFEPRQRPEPEPIVADDEYEQLATDTRLLTGFDPEARRGAVRQQNRERRKAVAGQLVGAGSQFVLGLLLAALSVGLITMAAMVRERGWVVAASIVAPPAFVYLAIRWRKWLGAAPYCYRLLTSLGEDADDLLQDYRQRRLLRAKRREQGRMHRQLKRGRARA